MNAITIKNLSLMRGAFTLGPISLQIQKGEFVALLGQTGAGKTLLLETLAGFYQGEYNGEIHIFDEDAKTLPMDRRRMGFVYQDCGLFPHMTVKQNISYGLTMHHIPQEVAEDRIKGISELFSISHIHNLYPAAISGGEKQRTALARALVLEPDILLLDEPFTGLDPATRRIIHKQIRSVHKELGCTILLVTHDFNEARDLAQKIGILLGGRLRTFTDTNNLFRAPHEDMEVAAFLKGS